MFDLVHLNEMIVNDERKRNAGKETEGGGGMGQQSPGSHQLRSSYSSMTQMVLFCVRCAGAINFY